MAKARKNPDRVWLPRQTWAIKPFDRIRESGKRYNRQEAKAAIYRECSSYPEPDGLSQFQPPSQAQSTEQSPTSIAKTMRERIKAFIRKKYEGVEFVAIKVEQHDRDLDLDLDLESDSGKLYITIYTPQAGALIGRRGRQVKELEKDLSALIRRELAISTPIMVTISVRDSSERGKR